MERNNNSTVTTTFGENEVAGSGCYVCMRCRTHIALPADSFGDCLDSDSVFSGFFRKAINLQVDGPAHYKTIDYGQTVAPVYCGTCGTRMGYKYIEVNKRLQYVVIEKGEFQLEFGMLLLNHNNQILNPVTRVPVPERFQPKYLTSEKSEP